MARDQLGESAPSADGRTSPASRSLSVRQAVALPPVSDPAGELTPHPHAPAPDPPDGTGGPEHATAETRLSEEDPSHDPAEREEVGGWLATVFGSRSRYRGAREDGSLDDVDDPGAEPLVEEETPH